MKEGVLELLGPRIIMLNKNFLHTQPADEKGLAIKLSKLFDICHPLRKINVNKKL